MSRRYLLTGVSGFLGSHLSKAFLRNNWEVFAFKRSSSDLWRLKEIQDKVFFFDIDDLELPFKKFGDFDGVIHAATCYGRNGEGASDISYANIELPFSLLELSVKYDVPLFVNTDTFYRKFPSFSKNNPYCESKAEFLFGAVSLSSSSRMKFVTLMLEHLYGPDDSLHKFIPFIVSECKKKGNTIPLTPGNQKRDFIYVDDVVNAYCCILEQFYKGTVLADLYEVGTGEAYSIKDIVVLINRAMGDKAKLQFGDIKYKDNEIMESVANAESLIKLGWKPMYDIYEGVKALLNEC